MRFDDKIQLAQQVLRPLRAFHFNGSGRMTELDLHWSDDTAGWSIIANSRVLMRNQSVDDQAESSIKHQWAYRAHFPEACCFSRISARAFRISTGRGGQPWMRTST